MFFRSQEKDNRANAIVSAVNLGHTLLMLGSFDWARFGTVALFLVVSEVSLREAIRF
jgi:hypothetical protein